MSPTPIAPPRSTGHRASGASVPFVPSRRRLLGASIAGAGLSGLLAACGSDKTPAAQAAGSGSWSFTDDRGTTVRLPTQPRRVALLTDTVTSALWPAGLRPVAAFASDPATTESVQLNLAKEGIVQIGGKDAQLDLEALAGAKPDLLIDVVQADGTLQTVGKTAAAAQIAPVVGISMYQPIEHIVTTAENITAAVGARLADTEAKTGYQSAAEKVRSAVKSNPGVRVGFVFDIGATELAVMNSGTWPILKTVAGLGVELVAIAQSEKNTYSQPISWERAPQIPADLLVWAVTDPLPTNPLWAKIPAVAAGQFWRPDLASWYTYSYANFTGLLTGLADHLAAAKPGIGPTSPLS
ncbi:ABC transporter substrate-binding protein [Catenulispora sp. NF23]|uniref:ABC transporter substrate-binding protein n=1 Tax=Catenulispora pinistramenti TaxID=2705254 RepID=A0ABS5KRP7_9ACTN|nr:ABC transporter substrate-binding protein [Catenulispora pinistramenti]MBS2536887.1 ABC transporter substrate-binding protein [Catenulispora pinistramenti]MBS2548665.1 ABC transporter substrate-binding protein [Catenulispora pinistramenti]